MNFIYPRSCLRIIDLLLLQCNSSLTVLFFQPRLQGFLSFLGGNVLGTILLFFKVGDNYRCEVFDI